MTCNHLVAQNKQLCANMWCFSACFFFFILFDLQMTDGVGQHDLLEME